MPIRLSAIEVAHLRKIPCLTARQGITVLQGMKKLLALLLALFSATSKAEPTKLGSDGDPIRQMLFASQSLKEQVRQMKLDGSPGVFQSIATAAKLAEVGDKEKAITLLRSVLDTPQL